MYRALAYLRFISQSTNQHGVHSPFVFKFVTQCLYGALNKNIKHQIKNYPSAAVDLSDFNSSKIMTSTANEGSIKKENITKIHNHSPKVLKKAFTLSKVMNYFNFKTVLKLSNATDLKSYAMAISLPGGALQTIQALNNTSEVEKARFKNQEYTYVESLNSFTQKTLNAFQKTYDCIYFDEPVLAPTPNYHFKLGLNLKHNDSVFIFDDMYRSKEMAEAWEFIKQHPKVTVTVDTFHLGFVFFRREQAKEHFKIRL